MSNIDKRALREAAEKATPGRIGDRIDGSGSIKYQCFGNDGSLVLQTDHKNMEYGFIGENSEADELFFRMCDPATVLALLDELEAKDKCLNEILTPNMLLPVIDGMDADNLRHVIKTVCENYSLLHAKWEAAEKQISELEATVSEPVAFRSKLKASSAAGWEHWDYTDHRQPDAFELENCVIERLYTAHPAPVSVPAGYRLQPISEYDAMCSAMLQGAERVSNRDEFPLDYLQGHKDGLEWAAQMAEANHPQTGDWLYDDPVELAKAIRKGPDMPELKSVPADADDNFYSWFGRFWSENYQQNNYTTSAKQMLGTMAEFAFRAGRESATQVGNSPAIPDGWVMVPVEPTTNQWAAGMQAFDSGMDKVTRVYRAMIAAAPQREA